VQQKQGPRSSSQEGIAVSDFGALPTTNINLLTWTRFAFGSMDENLCALQ
jgi:hypothetical protein